MELATFKAKCKNTSCGHDFDVPVLSPFSYGEYIYSSVNGKEIRYYSGSDCETWAFVEKTMSEGESREDSGQLIQKVIGLIADRPHPDAYFTQNYYCPECHSRVSSIDENNKTGSTEYEHLTFSHFSNLTNLEKKKLIFERL